MTIARGVGTRSPLACARVRVRVRVRAIENGGCSSGSRRDSQDADGVISS